jgi:hypothetical protein
MGLGRQAVGPGLCLRRMPGSRACTLLACLALPPALAQHDLLDCVPEPSAVFGLSADGAALVALSPSGVQAYARQGDEYLPVGVLQREFTGTSLSLSHSGLMAALRDSSSNTVRVLQRQPGEPWHALANVSCPCQGTCPWRCGAIALSGDGGSLLLGAGEYELGAGIYSAPSFDRAQELPADGTNWGSSSVALDSKATRPLIAATFFDPPAIFPIGKWFSAAGAPSPSYLSYNSPPVGSDDSYSNLVAVSGDGGTVAMGVKYQNTPCGVVVWAETGPASQSPATFSPACSSAAFPPRVSLNINGTVLLADTELFVRRPGDSQWSAAAPTPFPGPGLLSADGSTVVVTEGAQSGCVFGRRSPVSNSPAASPTQHPSPLQSHTSSASALQSSTTSPSASVLAPLPPPPPQQQQQQQRSYFIPFVAIACVLGCSALALASWTQRALLARLCCWARRQGQSSYNLAGEFRASNDNWTEAAQFRASDAAYSALN